MEKQFWISEEYLVSEFCEELDIQIAQMIDREFAKLKGGENDDLYNEFVGGLNDIVYGADQAIWGMILDMVIEEKEIDEGSGTWGYYLINIEEHQIEKIKQKIYREIKESVEYILTKGAFRHKL